jgi:hypothetical protein
MNSGNIQYTDPVYQRPYIPLIVLNPAEVATCPADLNLCIKVQNSGRENLQTLIPQLQNGDNKFMLMIDSSSDIPDNGFIDHIIHCLFSPQYINKAGSPVMAFYKAKDTVVSGDTFVRKVLEALRNQGFDDILNWEFHSGDQEAVSSVPAFITNPNQIDERFIRNLMLSGISRISNFILFDSGQLSGTINMEKEFYSLLTKILDSEPLVAKAVRQYTLQHHAMDVLKAQHKELAEKLANAETTISVIRNKYKDDYENLFKWYHNEYEILPLWYKRFGHILKVLMGKRSFRSLFSDDVKKYKT